uniref:Uncharacterized protein n=1 Tax=Oryza sativa subsp. japonica TaxID=39947 RepID=Q5Z5M3_ORYSJ|nr:hypothetical protein [Oryza sativa Japonica Group]
MQQQQQQGHCSSTSNNPSSSSHMASVTAAISKNQTAATVASRRSRQQQQQTIRSATIEEGAAAGTHRKEGKRNKTPVVLDDDGCGLQIWPWWQRKDSGGKSAGAARARAGCSDTLLHVRGAFPSYLASYKFASIGRTMPQTPPYW